MFSHSFLEESRLGFCLLGEFVAGADRFGNSYRLAAKKRSSFLSIFLRRIAPRESFSVLFLRERQSPEQRAQKSLGGLPISPTCRTQRWHSAWPHWAHR